MIFFYRFFTTCKEGQMKTTLTLFQHPLLPHLVPTQGILPHALLPHVLPPCANYPLSLLPHVLPPHANHPLYLLPYALPPQDNLPHAPLPHDLVLSTLCIVIPLLNHQLHFHALPPAPLLTERDPETRLPDLL